MYCTYNSTIDVLSCFGAFPLFCQKNNKTANKKIVSASLSVLFGFNIFSPVVCLARFSQVFLFLFLFFIVFIVRRRRIASVVPSSPYPSSNLKIKFLIPSHFYFNKRIAVSRFRVNRRKFPEYHHAVCCVIYINTCEPISDLIDI